MKKKNVVGALVMAGLLALSVPLGVNRSLTKLREKAADQYYYDNAGFAIYKGLDNREAAARNLITVAKRYTAENPKLTALVDELEYSVSTLENLYDDYGAQAETNRGMGEAAQALYEELQRTQLSEKDAKYPEQLIAQMKSEQDKIERSSYNKEAREFNEKLEQFPVSYLRYAAGMKPLDTFD